MPDYVKSSGYPDLRAAVADIPDSGVVEIDNAIVLSAVYTLARPVRFIDGGGSISGAGVRVIATAAEVEGVKFPAPTGRALSFANGAVGCKATGVEIDGAGDHGLVDQGTETVVTECKITGSAQHNLWGLGSDGGVYSRNECSGAGHQNFELNHARRFTVDYHHSHHGNSLGLHLLRSEHGRVRRLRSHDNRNNGMDCNGSSFLKVFDLLSWGNGSTGAQDQEGGAEGTGLLLYRSHNIDVRGGAAWNNAQGQPNNRDGLAISGVAGGPAYDIRVEGFVGFDTQTPPTQRRAVGVYAQSPGDTHDVEIVHCLGYGNVSGTFGFKNIDFARDRVTIR